MRQLQSSSLVPPGFIVEHAERDRAEVQLTLRHRAESSPCPGCGTAARRIHSRYHRTLADLPMAGWTVRLRLEARRFRCDTAGSADGHRHRRLGLASQPALRDHHL